MNDFDLTINTQEFRVPKGGYYLVQTSVLGGATFRAADASDLIRCGSDEEAWEKAEQRLSAQVNAALRGD